MKQVIVVNEALRLPRGKLAAQVAHGAVAAFLQAGPEAQERWLVAGMPKVVLRCESELELLQLEDRALGAGVPAVLIRDAGRTVVPAGTPTCLGIGPADAGALDALTGLLRLVR
jgi:peptidyl-tRNA hydrolase